MPPFPELKDISPPTPPPFSSPEEVQAVVWSVFGGFAALLLLVAFWLWWRWRVRRAQAPPLPQPALDRLRRQLTDLHPQAAALPATALGQQVGDAIRTYLQRDHGLLARYRTTEELFGTTRGPRRADAPPPLPFLRPFERVFARCDALKFAGADAPPGLKTEVIDLALAATDEVRVALAPRPTPPPAPAPTATAGNPPPLATPAETGSRTAEPPPLPPASAFTLGDGAGTAAGSGDATAPPHEPSAGAIGRTSAVDADALPVVSSAPAAGPSPAPPRHRSDTFTHPPTAAFARGADVIPS